MITAKTKKLTCGAMAMKRDNTEQSRANIRTTRMYDENGCWFFKTREGDTVGPFRDELEASTQLEVYIRLIEAGLPGAPHEFFSSQVTQTSAR